MEENKHTNFRNLNYQGFSLSLKEFICCTLCTHLAFSHFIRHLNLIQKYGILMLISFHILNIYIFSVPIFTFQTFVGVYTRKSFIKFWDIMPILKGVSYCIFLNIMYNVIMNVMYGIQSLIIALNHLRVKVPSTNCSFYGVSKYCRPITIKTEFTNKCCSGIPSFNCPTIYKFSSYEYYKVFKYGDPEEDTIYYTSSVQWDWIFANTFVFSLVYVFLYFDIRRYRTVVTNFILFCGILVIPVTTMSLFLSYNYGRPRNLESSPSDFANPEFWIEAYMHAGYWERPGEFIFYGSLASNSYHLPSVALFVYTFKIMLLSITAIWYSIGTQIIQYNYKIDDVMCINLKGRDLFFSVIPDLLSKLWFPQIWLMAWFILIFLWCMSQSILAMTVNLNSLSENFSTIRSHRLLSCFFYVLFQSLPCYLFLNQTFRLYFQAWRKSGYFIYSMTFLASEMIALAVYSIQRISNDYHFKYGQKLSAYCIYSWKISIFYSMIIFIIFCIHYREIKGSAHQKGTNRIIVYIVCATLACPMVLYAIGRLIYYKIKPVRMLTPMHTWGSPDLNDQLQRINFFPQKRTRYNQEQVRCKHNCLRISDKLADEVFLMEQKKLYLERALDETADVYKRTNLTPVEINVSKKKKKKKQKFTLNN